MTRRTFTPEFKRKIVEEHLLGGRTIAEICREYHLGRNLFDSWRQAYQQTAMPAGPTVEEVSRQLREAEKRIAELEAALGRSAMETDFLKRCFKRAKLPFPTGPKA
ncbi:MAG TPA: transposase [Acidobacteriota bacterium]|nr:transposase [Acidobacteriota bacterium]